MGSMVTFWPFPSTLLKQLYEHKSGKWKSSHHSGTLTCPVQTVMDLIQSQFKQCDIIIILISEWQHQSIMACIYQPKTLKTWFLTITFTATVIWTSQSSNQAHQEPETLKEPALNNHYMHEHVLGPEKVAPVLPLFIVLPKILSMQQH